MSRRNSRSELLEPFDCPVCGAHVPAGRLSCRACGASDEDGWRDDAETVGMSEEDDELDYEEFVERELSGTEPTSISPGKLLLWVLFAAFVLTALAPIFLGGF